MNRETDVKTSNIMGIEVACIDKERLLEIAFDWCNGGKKRTIMYVNAHCLNIARQNENFTENLKRADLVYADGIGIVWASRFLNSDQTHKITGREWFFNFCQLAEEKGIKVAILGGRPGVAKKAIQILKIKFPKLQIDVIGDGFSPSQDDGIILDRIMNYSPDVLFVGMGTPKQESWVMTHRDAIIVPVCWTIGAAIDYIVGVEKPYPVFLQFLPLEWLWRLAINPKDKWKRYLLGIPQFILSILNQKYLLN